MRLPVFFRRVSSSATGTNRPGQCAKAVGSNVSKRACSFQSLRACRRYSALPSRWSKPKPARMRVSVAVPTTVKEPKACRRARRKLRSCRNTGRHRETSARKRVSSTAVWPWLYFYQASTQVHQPPIENVQTPANVLKNVRWSLDILGSSGEDHLRIIAGAVVNGGEMGPFVPLLA